MAMAARKKELDQLLDEISVEENLPLFSENSSHRLKKENDQKREIEHALCENGKVSGIYFHPQDVDIASALRSSLCSDVKQSVSQNDSFRVLLVLPKTSSYNKIAESVRSALQENYPDFLDNVVICHGTKAVLHAIEESSESLSHYLYIVDAWSFLLRYGPEEAVPQAILHFLKKKSFTVLRCLGSIENRGDSEKGVLECASYFGISVSYIEK